jgi:hypothetical protein
VQVKGAVADLVSSFARKPCHRIDAKDALWDEIIPGLELAIATDPLVAVIPLRRLEIVLESQRNYGMSSEILNLTEAP